MMIDTEVQVFSRNAPQIAASEAQWMDQNAASVFLWKNYGIKRSAKTLQKYRCVGGGPPYRVVLGRIIYEPGPTGSWAEAQRGPLVSSTSELPPRAA